MEAAEQALKDLKRAAHGRRLMGTAVSLRVVQCREAGCTWQQVADALDMTKAGAWLRYAEMVERWLSDGGHEDRDEENRASARRGPPRAT